MPRAPNERVSPLRGMEWPTSIFTCGLLQTRQWRRHSACDQKIVLSRRTLCI